MFRLTEFPELACGIKEVSLLVVPSNQLMQVAMFSACGIEIGFTLTIRKSASFEDFFYVCAGIGFCGMT